MEHDAPPNPHDAHTGGAPPGDTSGTPLVSDTAPTIPAVAVIMLVGFALGTAVGMMASLIIQTFGAVVTETSEVFKE